MFTKTWALDALERVAKTWVQVFIAQIAASGLDIVEALSDTSTVERAAVAGLGAVASLIMSALSQWSANPGTASLVPSIVAVDDGPVAPPPHPEL